MGQLQVTSVVDSEVYSRGDSERQETCSSGTEVLIGGCVEDFC